MAKSDKRELTTAISIFFYLRSLNLHGVFIARQSLFEIGRKHEIENWCTTSGCGIKKNKRHPKNIQMWRIPYLCDKVTYVAKVGHSKEMEKQFKWKTKEEHKLQRIRKQVTYWLVVLYLKTTKQVFVWLGSPTIFKNVTNIISLGVYNTVEKP